MSCCISTKTFPRVQGSVSKQVDVELAHAVEMKGNFVQCIVA
jgi:hypothetical protein